MSEVCGRRVVYLREARNWRLVATVGERFLYPDGTDRGVVNRIVHDLRDETVTVYTSSPATGEELWCGTLWSSVLEWCDLA